MYALKLEVAGIQNYIFSSNKLKVNLGASYIIEHLLFQELLKEVVKIKVDSAYAKDIEEWSKATKIEEIPQGDHNFRIGYIGGGSAVLFFEKQKTAEEVEKEMKLQTLAHFPGLEIYTGIYDFEPADDYMSMGKHLSSAVQKNRSERPFVNRTFNHGFFNDCAVTGDVASKYWKFEDKWVSDEVCSKVQYAEGKWEDNAANNQHRKSLLVDSKNKEKDNTDIYVFPVEFEQLSAEEDKAYMAIVHIDGNNLGTKFINASSLDETQKLSLAVRELGTEALKQTIKEGLVPQIQSHGHKKWILGNLDLYYTEDKKDGSIYPKLHLPIRPLITGGDDITFVCEGSLGVPLAELFLKNFHEIAKLKLSDNNIHACAGVAIIKQKYPFYRGYQLSEELIQEAKKASRKANGSYLSFMVAGYGTGTSLEDLKNKYANEGLFAQTYRVIEGKTDEEKGVYDYQELVNLIQLFKEEKNGQKSIPSNKLLQVREAIVTGELDKVWPVVNSRLKIENKDWDPKISTEVTFDAIEILDFYNDAFVQSATSEDNKETAHEKV